jgi:hypothetical protein
MRAYIEVLAAVMTCRRELANSDLRLIGKFKRENILRWWLNTFDGGVYGCEDFHAVCGDVDIPWTTEEGRRVKFVDIQEQVASEHRRS